MGRRDRSREQGDPRTVRRDTRTRLAGARAQGLRRGEGRYRTAGRGRRREVDARAAGSARRTAEGERGQFPTIRSPVRGRGG